MNRLQRIVLCIFISLLSLKAYAEAVVVDITAEQWAIPRHGERIVNMPAMRKLIQVWQNNPDKAIEINYPGGENGELWLRELMDWLIALGISSDNIKTTVGSGSKDIIKLTVLVAGGIIQ